MSLFVWSPAVEIYNSFWKESKIRARISLELYGVRKPELNKAQFACCALESGEKLI